MLQAKEKNSGKVNATNNIVPKGKMSHIPYAVLRDLTYSFFYNFGVSFAHLERSHEERGLYICFQASYL
jgi:hypothetical protein